MDYNEYKQVLNNINSYIQSDLGSQYLMATKPNFSYLYQHRDNLRLKEATDFLNKGYDLEISTSIDINFELNQVNKGFMLTSQQLFKVLKVARNIVALRKYFQNKEDLQLDNLDELVDTLSFDNSLIKYLTTIVDDNGEIRLDASDNLKQLYDQQAIIKGRFDKVIKTFLNNNKESLQENFTTSRDGRLCVLVVNSDKNKYHGFQHGQTASGQAVYIEPDSFISYNNQLINNSDAINNEIDSILLQASMNIAKQSLSLNTNMETLALLDVIFAKAKWGIANYGCVANVSNNKTGYELINVRHPLIDKTKVVSNTITCTNGKKSILITGANTAGKTVLLKTIGLSFMMAASGIPVLADSADLCLIDQILDDIGDQQSIIESLSTFSSHVLAWKNACQLATNKSLILLDELGTGTDPKEGQALGQALLEQLIANDCYIVATTHFQSIKEYGLTVDSVILGCMDFNVETLKPTYKFIQGSLGTSYAFEIALQCGLDESLINRSKQLKQQQESASEQLLKALSIKEHDLTVEKETFLKEKEKFIQENTALKQQYQEKLESLDKQYQEKIEQMQVSVTKKIDELNDLLATIKQEPAANKINIIKHKMKDYQIDNPTFINEPIQEGDYAKLNNSNSIVKVLKIKNNKVDALLNGKTIHTSLDSLTKTVNTMPNKAKYHKQVTHEFVPKAFDTRLNILGLTVDEGIEKAAAFIDSALYANQKRIVIITGDGTGRLRNGIHQFLKTNKFVDHYELASRSEGATGATVVYLK